MTPRADAGTVRAAVGLAVRAPSVHNSQPWLFRSASDGLHLYADPTRHLAATDPDGRDLLVSCGAVLHHLRVSLAAFGWLPVTDRLPNPDRPDQLATVDTVPRPALPHDLSLAEAIPHRRSDRRKYLPTVLDEDITAELAHQAASNGVRLRVVRAGPVRTILVSAIAEATMLQRANPSYVYELARWTGDRHGVDDGVPSADTPGTSVLGNLTVRRYCAPRLHIDESTSDGAGTLLVLGTTTDDRLSRLRAGEATSAVLLAATRLGLATCALTQPLEIAEVRDAVRTGVLGATMIPQMMLRAGWASDQPDPSRPSRRRPVAEVLVG